MLRNYLTESGTLTCIPGNDAYAPWPYWSFYTYKSLTTDELNALKNNNYDVTAFTLASGQYTCLEVTVSGSVFLGALRCYFGNTNTNYLLTGLAIEQPTYLLTTVTGVFMGDGSKNTSTTRAVPTMTSNTAPAPYVVSTSRNHSLDYQIFSQPAMPAGWDPQDYTGWIKVDCGVNNPKCINKYRYKTWWNPNRPIRSWVLRASNDNINWVDLDIRNDQYWLGAPNFDGVWSIWFTFYNDQRYRYYLFDILAGWANYINLEKIEYVEAITFPSFTKEQIPHTVYFDDVARIEREDVKGVIAYWEQLEGNIGYFESEPIPLLTAETVNLVSADYHTTPEISLPESRDLTNQSIRQIIRQPSGLPETSHVSLTLSGAQDGPVSLSHVSIAPINITVSSTLFDSDHVQDHAVRGDIRHWVSDIGKCGHFEGDPILLDVGQTISGTWIQDEVWAGVGTPDPITNKQGYAIRQLIPGTEVTSTNDGIRVTLQSTDEDIVIRNMSYMPATSTVVTLDFQTNSSFEQRNIKGPIVRWKNDGIVTGVNLQNITPTDIDLIDNLVIEKSQHYGHFEGPEVDFDDGQEAIMYDANVIGFRCTNHGLVPGDYITVEGTEFYDGQYIVLTFSTAHIVVVWGIYDEETFTPSAKIRKIISIGPQIDDYGAKQDARDVVAYTQINFLNGHTGYIIDYNSYGKGYGSVELSIIEENTEITSIYDVLYDESGYLSSTPGPSITPEYESSMPDFSSGNLVFKSRTSILGFMNLGYELDDPGRAYVTRSSEKWAGSFFVVCEAQDPEFEGDWTGWEGTAKFFDRRMSQPWECLIKDECPWIDLCYRGPMPVKFGFDLGSPKVFSKYRMWVQTVLCGTYGCPDPACSKPKSWKFQASNTPDVESSWVTLEQVIDYDPDLFAPSQYPPDRQIPGTCAVGDWFDYPTLELYRYYRLLVYDVWVKPYVYNKMCSPVGTESTHICELDFCEHRTSPGLFPAIVNSTIFFDKVHQVLPNEHMRENSTAYYSLSFDGGLTWSIYEQDHWKTIAKNDGGVWKYYREFWRTADENNARKALWHAFSAGSNRMTSTQLQSIPQADYLTLMVSGCYPQFGVGLVSNGVIESLLEGITIKGIAYNPVGTATPQEFLFDGQRGCTISGGYNILTSDWLNVTVPADLDILIASDIDESSGALSRLSGYTDYRYFELPKFASYDEQTVVVSDFTSQSGVVLLKNIEVRKSDLVIFPATNNGLQISDWVTLTGTSFYNKLYNVKYALPDFFGVTEKHTVEIVSPDAYATQLITVNTPTSYAPDVQVGSVVEFSEPSYYLTTNYMETAPSGLYWVTENTCQPGKEATYAFDIDSSVEFHSGRPIDKGPVIIGLGMTEQRTFNKLRIKSSSNYYYWDIEFPHNVEVSASNLTSPSLENESHWTFLTSGVCVLPIAPNRYSDFMGITASGAYYHYRLKVNSIYGDNTCCVRLGKLEFSDDSGSNIGFTILEAKQGFDARYLFDGTTYSQYVSKYPMSSGVVNIGIDYRSKPVQITAFNLTAVKDSVTVGSQNLAHRLVSPKTVSLWASTSGTPRLDVDADWIKLTQVDYDKPGGDLPSGGEAVTGPTITIPYSPEDSVRRIEGNLVAGNTNAISDNNVLFVDLTIPLDNGYVIDKIGLNCLGTPGEARFKLCKNINDLTWEVSDIGPINHPSDGLHWTTLSAPLKVPAVGNYYVGIWRGVSSLSSLQRTSSGKNFRYANLGVIPSPGPTGTVTLGSYRTDLILPLVVQYMAFDDLPSSALNYRLQVSSVWGGSTYNMELSGMSIETAEGNSYTETVTYSEASYPVKLLDLPAYYQVTGMVITSVSGTQGGYVEVDGNPDTASGTYSNSFWTIVDRHWNLDNGKAIAYVGVDSDLASNISFRIFKDRNVGGEWYDIWDIATFTHSGGGFRWFKLTNPYEIPSDGATYHLGWYQPNFPRMMGDYTGAQLVSYQYGDYTGTNINLPLHSTQRPHLAVRYSTYFTVGTDTDHDIMYPAFSPGTDGHQYVGGTTLGPFTTASAVYLYRPATPIVPDTQGITTYTFYFEDSRGDTYNAWPYTISGSASFEATHFAQHLMDGDPSTFFYSYRKLDETQHLYFMLRFDEPSYINAFRFQTGSSYNYYLEHFPTMITIGGSNSPRNLLSSDGWDELYFDDGFLAPRTNATKLPWVYFDDYVDSYRYFRFDPCHSNFATGYSSLAEMELLINKSYQSYHIVEEPYNVIQRIVGSGIDPASIEMLYHPGVHRAVKEIYNTFTSYGASEPSPGSYFYHGENNLNTVCPTPEVIFKYDPENPEDIPFTVVELGNSNIMAWHTLDEEEGDYDDLSGNNVIATRVGPVLSNVGKVGRCAYISDDNSDEERNIRFTLPSRLTEYTVAFWFKPGHTVDVGYTAYYDIMGGWVSYGAIPGVWHISYYQDLLFNDSPYPYLQPKECYYQSRLVFGNYGKAIVTGRYRWPNQVWHHIAYAFKSDGSMKVWVDGAPDIYSSNLYSDVYPSDSVIMVDPTDIHYTERDQANCMYFGLPLKGSDGVKGEFSLDNVMHFNKYLTDEEVFNMYRLKYPTLNQDGLYFAKATTLEAPGKIVVDFGRRVCLTRFGIRSSVDTPLLGPEVKYGLDALDPEEGWKILSEVYDYVPPPSAPLIRKEEEFLITISGTFPRKLFTLRDSIERLEVYLGVDSPCKGGWYSKQLDIPTTWGFANYWISGDYTYVFQGNPTGIPGGTYISDIGMYSSVPITGITYKAVFHWDASVNSIFNICSGITHPGTGNYWYHLPEPYLIPASGAFWEPGLYLGTGQTLVGFAGNTQRQYGVYYRLGNQVGDRISIPNSPGIVNEPKIAFRSSPTYSLLGDGNSLVSSQFAGSGIVMSWSGTNNFANLDLYLGTNAIVPDTQGVVRVRIVYYEKDEVPEVMWNNLLNTKAYQYYGINIYGSTTCATGINISSLHFSDVPVIPSVSGNYSTTISGIYTVGKYIPYIRTFIEQEEFVDTSLSRDDQFSWTSVSASGVESLTHGDFQSVGSGDLSIAHTFRSSPSVSGIKVYPYHVGITDWSLLCTPSVVTFGGNPSVVVPLQTSSDSDYINYTTSGNQWDMVILDIITGKVSWSPESPSGYLQDSGETYNLLTGGEYTPSGINILTYTTGRFNDSISIPVVTDTLSSGGLVDITDATYSGVFVLTAASGNRISLSAPLYSTSLSGGSFLRRIVPCPSSLLGNELSFTTQSGATVESSSEYQTIVSDVRGSQAIQSIHNLVSQSSGVALAFNKGFDDMVGGQAFKLDSLGMTSNTDPAPYSVHTDYNDVEELTFIITEKTDFPYKLMTITPGTIIDSVGVEIIDPARDAYQFDGDVSAGDVDGVNGQTYVDGSLVLGENKELTRIGFYTTSAVPLVFLIYEDCFNTPGLPIAYYKTLVTGTHLGNGLNYFDLPETFVVPEKHWRFRIAVSRTYQDAPLQKSIHTSVGSSLYYGDSVNFYGYPISSNPTYSSLAVWSNSKLAIQAGYRATFSVGYDSSHQDFFVPKFTAASGTQVAQQGPAGPYSIPRDIYMYFQGDTLKAINLKVTITKKKNIYKVLDGLSEDSVVLSDVVVDLGESGKFDGYRFFPGETVSGWGWSVYGATTIPYWTSISGNFSVIPSDYTWTSVFDLDSDYRYYAFKFDNQVQLRELQFTNRLSLSSGVACSATSSGTDWVYNYLGRIARIDVDSSEPSGTALYHAVTFDQGITYKVFDTDYWRPVIRDNAGQWEYYDTSWMTPPQNTKFSALRSIIDAGSYRFPSVELEQVEESEWHGAGAAANAGTLGFIQYFKGQNPYSPVLYGYHLHHITRSGGNDVSWLGSLVPSGYGYTVATQSGVTKKIDIPYRIDSGYETIYGRVETSKFRLYLANPSASGVPVSELAVLDVQLPDHPYYTEPFTYPTHLAPIMSSGVQIPELHDEHVRTGGIIIPENTAVDYEIREIPDDLGLFYGELRVYFTKGLDAPNVLSVAPEVTHLSGTASGTSFIPTSTSGLVILPYRELNDDHYSIYFWSGHPLATIAVRVGNNNPVGSGIVRVNELAIFPLDFDGGWNVPDVFNHLESADNKNVVNATVSGVIRMPPVPMTSYTTPSPYKVYSNADYGASYEPWRMFDYSDSTWWMPENFSFPRWCMIETGPESTSHRIFKYRLKPTFVLTDASAWCKSWVVEGSNDLVGWDLLDSVDNAVRPAEATWTSYYYIVKPNFYRYYRIVFTDSAGYKFRSLELDYQSDAWTNVQGAQQELSTPHLERLFNTSISGAIPLFPNRYVGVESNLNRFSAKSKEFRLYVDSNQNLNASLYTQVSGSVDWTQRNLTWSGAGYFYSPFDTETITATKVFCSNTASASGGYNSIRWLRAIQLINTGEDVAFGATGSGIGVADLPTIYARYEQIKVYNNNRTGTYANARVLPRFSNNYHLDRVVLISEDQVNWSHVDVGTNLPEDYSFGIGEFEGTNLAYDGAIELNSNTTSGHWISPVIEILDPSSTACYVYCENIAHDESYITKDFQSGMNIVEVRSSNTKPIHSFLVTGVDTSPTDGLQYPWKMVAFDSNGSDSSWPARGMYDPARLERGSLTAANSSPRRMWPYSSRLPLWQFYGFLDANRRGAISLGQEYGGNFDITEDGSNRNEDWYRAYYVWPQGVAIPSTDPASSQNLHIYPRTNAFLYPIFNKALRYTTRAEGGVNKGAFHFVDAILRTQPFYERFQEYYYADTLFHLRNLYSFQGSASTPESNTEIDYLYSFPGLIDALYTDGVRFGSCLDNHSDSFSYWVHYAHEYDNNNYYRTLLVTDERVEKEFTNIELKFNYVLEGAHDAPRGFWGLAERAVYWLEYEGGALSVRYSVSSDSLGKEFKLITFGNIDYNNNLWFVDLMTERVIRINFEDLQAGNQPVDYSRAIDGASSVYPDPYDGSAYVYVIRDPEFPTNDCVKIVHVGDYDYIVPETVCVVPGVSLIESYNVNLYGRSTTPQGYYTVLPQDVFWNDDTQWERYSAGSPTLPKGHYKQLKVTLRRRDLASASPRVRYIRIPKPALLNKIPWHGYRDLFIDTLSQDEDIDLASGDYTLDLLIWWPRE
jgi:hypothetical protein